MTVHSVRRMARWGAITAALGVCLSPAFAQNGAAARVVNLNGRVSVLRDTTPWALNAGDSIQPRQIVVTGADGYAEFSLADGSRFEVFPNSRVTFRDNPGDWKDLLEVLIGRIKVHIQKLGGQPNHNRVRTPTAVIAVRGTIFDVVVDEDGDSTLVSVEEGEVAVNHRQLPLDKPRELKPGDWIRVVRNVPLADKRIDKGSIVQRGLRAAAEAWYQIILRTQRGPGGGSVPTSTGGVPAGQPADTGGSSGDTPPPPPPPPPQQ